MQQPRRTTEFQEDPTKSRQTRGSRRPASMERIVPSSSLRPTCGSAMRGRTPIRTPQQAPPTQRVLFTAEKRGGPNDKKWVQEKTELIMEYLNIQHQQGKISGINGDFFTTRGAGLRHMTTKQFVAIVNHFLPFISGNRYTVTAGNYVEEIVAIAQKLHYPYQLNKSWLKTPTSPLSFGNVIIFLDFLLEFAPPWNEEQQATWFFPMQDLELQNAAEEEHQVMPDAEFQELFMAHAEKGFRLWDHQKMDEFEALQQQTINVLIQKRCGVEGTIALDVEIKRLEQELNDINKARPRSISSKEMEQYQQDEDHLNRKLKEIEKLREELANNDEQLQQLLAHRETAAEQVKTLEKENAKTRAIIKQQSCSVEQRDSLIEDIAQLRHTLQCKTRTLNEVQERYHNEQIQLSRAKKLLTTQTEKLNVHLGEIAYSLKKSKMGAQLSLEQLQLPQNADEGDLKRLGSLLHRIQQNLQKSVQEDEVLTQQMTQQNADVEQIIATKLEPQIKFLSGKTEAANTKLQQMKEQFEAASKQMVTRMLELDEELSDLRMKIASLTKSNEEQEVEVERLKELNEQTMSSAEEKYTVYAQQRKEYLDNYEATLNRDEEELEKLEKLVDKLEMEERFL